MLISSKKYKKMRKKKYMNSTVMYCSWTNKATTRHHLIISRFFFFFLGESIYSCVYCGPYIFWTKISYKSVLRNFIQLTYKNDMCHLNM
jgi:hypothetical protein